MFGLTTLYTGMNPQRLASIICYSHLCHEFTGAFAEFGVMKGGSLELLAKMHPERKIYGIDSFQGLPKPLDFEIHKEGDFNLSDDEFNYLLEYFSVNHKNVEILKGFSPDVFGKIKDETFSFVHIDVDMFTSVNDALDFFYPRLIDGGMILFDDYGFETTPGAKKAIDEWEEPCQWRGELKLAQNRFLGQYLIIK